MKKILITLFIVFCFLASFAQSQFTGIILYVPDSSAYVSQQTLINAHANGKSDIFYSAASGLYWVWYQGAYVNWDPTASGGGSVNTLAPNIQTGDYTIQANDTTDIIYMRNASTPQTATIPSGLKVGSTFVIVQDSTATTTVACTGCDLIGTATLTAKEVSVWHHRETGKYVRLGSSGTGAGLVDGDYGDITVGGTGTTMTIDNLAVTNAKVNDVAYSKLTSVPDAVADGATKGVASFTAADFNASSGNISIDYTNGQAAGAAQNGFVNQSAQTFAGVKTFSSDPLVPDEAYDATAWNGSLEPPTKNSVRDKIESLVSNKVFVIALSDEVSAISTGTAKMTFRMPYAMTVTAVRASLNVAQTGSGAGGLVTIAIKEGGVGILSTALTIDNGEKTSTTAATPAVISDSSLADDAEMTIDITTIGDGTAVGCKVYFIGNFIIFFLFPIGLIRKMKRLLILALLTIPTIVDAQVMVSSYRHYCEEYKAILVEARTQGWQAPSDVQVRRDNRAIIYYKDNSIWSKFDIFFGMTGNSDFARIDWVNPTGNKLTNTGSLSYDATNGFTGDGSNFMDTGWVPNSSTKFAQNSCSVGWNIPVGSATTGVSDFGAGNDASLTNGLNVNTRNASDQMPLRINRTALPSPIPNNGNSTGRWIMQRSASTAWSVYRNGTLQNSDTEASTGRTTFSVYLFAANGGGTASSFSTRSMNLWFAGEVMTGVEATLDAGFLLFK